MATKTEVNKQNDFSGGEVDPELKRSDDHPSFKISGRVMVNWRVLNARSLKNRPGRRVLFLEGKRVDEILMSPNNKFYIAFGNFYLRVYNASGQKVFDSGAIMPWSNSSWYQVVFDIFKLSLYITYPGMRPQVLTWDGVSQSSSWVLSPFTEQITGAPASSQKRTPFFRISPAGVTMSVTPSSGTNINAGQSVTLNFSAGMNLVAGHVGTRMRYYGRQVLITAVASAVQATATIEESLHHASSYQSTGNVDCTKSFAVGDVVIGQTSNSQGIVTGFLTTTNPNDTMVVQRKTDVQFIVGGGAETVVGPTGSLTFASVISGVIDPQPITAWDDEVINSFRGYPASCFVDQNRLGFCDFSVLPDFIAWSAVGGFTDLYTDDNNVGPTNSIQEVVPGKSRVLYVVPGTESSEFVFCDNAVYYIPITPTNPLQPGSVAFNLLTSDGAAQVKPARVQQSIIFINTGGRQVKAIQAIGAFSRPYVVEDISQLHAHLLAVPITIAVPSGSTQFEERYIYILNADGRLLVGKHTLNQGLLDTKTIGWLQWSTATQGTTAGTVTWISAQGTDFILTTSYAPNGISPIELVEQLDDTLYLDAAMPYNSAPAALAPPPGKGPLWWLAGGTVELMDGSLGTRMMGTYQIDADGFLIPQNNAGEDFTSVNLLCGQMWTAVFEPFIPPAQAGQDFGQRMWARRLKRVQVYVQDSTGFVMVRLYSGAIQTGLFFPIKKTRRIPAWNQDDDPTQPPPLREQSYLDRPLGRSHDPRWAIFKDTPGPLKILEIDTEVTV